MALTDSFIYTILAALETELKKIKTTAGYNNTVLLVDDEFKTPDEISSKQLPALLIVPGRINFTETSGQYSEGTFPIYVFGYVMDNATPIKKMIQLAQDVYACLAAAGFRLAGCDAVKPTGLEMSVNVFSVFGYIGGIRKPYAAFRMDIEAAYRFAQANGG